MATPSATRTIVVELPGKNAIGDGVRRTVSIASFGAPNSNNAGKWYVRVSRVKYKDINYSRDRGDIVVCLNGVRSMESTDNNLPPETIYKFGAEKSTDDLIDHVPSREIWCELYYPYQRNDYSISLLRSDNSPALSDSNSSAEVELLFHYF